ncbi:MAG TPA: aspartate-semialdehyde dehydrogenase [Polyangiaceae bacterium]|nr:aspartate-semialdehyde dehydrogenase [Polyangiaceae bacterium]
MHQVGIVGWRGMVGSVLLERMRAEADFAEFAPVFFSTSQAGADAPNVGQKAGKVEDAKDVQRLKALPVIVSCQGGDYTSAVYPELRRAGWDGYWIDAASTLRMQDEATIILDPINRGLIDEALARGVKSFIGGNCTVSLMLMAIGGLFQKGWIEWLNSHTYQAASGAGAKNMRELVLQMRALARAAEPVLADPAASALDLDRNVQATLTGADYPKAEFGAPLAGSLIPWIDKPMDDGRTREEWKGEVETAKILGAQRPVPVDGCCVRVGAMRSHSQALTIKLNRDLPIEEIERTIAESNPWVRVIPNDKQATLDELSPAAVSGTLNVHVGRLRKMRLGPEYVTAFTVGDQLLWGAAEPLRRMLRILLPRL